MHERCNRKESIVRNIFEIGAIMGFFLYYIKERVRNCKTLYSFMELFALVEVSPLVFQLCPHERAQGKQNATAATFAKGVSL